MRFPIIVAVCAALGVAAAWWGFRPGSTAGDAVAQAPAAAQLVPVVLPDLEGAATRGAAAFETFCAACHGPTAGGLDGKGPPLIHKIYEPSHHGDFAFERAARLGVRSHHWRFGDMPAVDGIDAVEIAAIIAYIRQVQRANGIF